jgi:hypothetical protein
MARPRVSQMLVLIYEDMWTDIPGDRYVKWGSAMKTNCSVSIYGVVCCLF